VDGIVQLGNVTSKGMIKELHRSRGCGSGPRSVQQPRLSTKLRDSSRTPSCASAASAVQDTSSPSGPPRGRGPGHSSASGVEKPSARAQRFICL
jgi:hypothetical protein